MRRHRTKAFGARLVQKMCEKSRLLQRLAGTRVECGVDQTFVTIVPAGGVKATVFADDSR